MFATVARAARAALLLLLAGSAHAAPAIFGPLPWQDAAPTALPFLQLPFEAPGTLPPGAIRTSIRTIYSSSIASAHSPAAEVEYRLETAQPTAAIRWGLAEGIELQVAVPVAIERDGFLDGPILTVESWFASGNPLRRPGSMPGEVHFRMIRPDGVGARFTGPQQSVADPWVGVKLRLRAPGDRGPALALRAALAVPVGRFPFGSGVPQAAVGLLGEVGAGGTHAWAAADLSVPFGSVTEAGFATRPHPSFQLAVGQDLGSRVMLLVQGSAHGSALRPLHISEVDGWTFYVLAGARVEPLRGLDVGLGLVENLIVTERGTDIAGVLDLVYHW